MKNRYKSTGHSAQVKKPSLFNVDTSCTTDDSYTTDSSSSKYNVTCLWNDAGSQNISISHATSLDACLNDCSSIDGCKGVVFDQSLAFGVSSLSMLAYPCAQTD